MIDLPLSIPSPPTGVWSVFGFPLRAYALCIIAGIVVGMIIATRRWRARGGSSESLEMVVVVAVPFGIIGARLYHVITDWQLYFGPGRDPLDALKIWNGGLGIWGAVALGVLGGYLVARRRKIRFPALLDAVAPGIVVAQAIGRLGQLVQPGVVRTAHHAAVGAGDRRRVPAGRLRGVRHLPPDVPLRAAVEPRGGGRV